MYGFDYDCVIYDGDIYCNGCLPDGIDIDSEDVMPIFSGSEWATLPVCCECGEIHTNVTLLPESETGMSHNEYETMKALCEWS